MSDLRLLHLADAHLGYDNGWLAQHPEARSREFVEAFRRAIEFACDFTNHIASVLIAGDLFDSPSPPPALFGEVSRLFEKLSRAGVRCFLVPGTHDGWFYPNCIYRSGLPGVTVLTSPNVGAPEVFEHEGVRVHVYGMAWQAARSRPPFDTFRRTEDEGIHVAVIHGSLEGNPEWQLRRKDVALNLQTLGESGMDYVALGHYHNFRVERIGRTTVAYPGSLVGKDLSEVGERGFCVATFRSSGAEVERVASPCRLIREDTIDLTVANVQSEEELAAQIERQFANPELILKLRLTGTAAFPVSREFLETRLRDRFFHFVVEDDSSLLESGLIGQMRAEPTIAGMFVRRMHERMVTATTDEHRTLELALRLVVPRLRGLQGGME